VHRGGPFASAFETNWMLQLERGGWWVRAAATEAAFAAGVLDAGGWIDPFFAPGDLSDAIRRRGGVTFLPPAVIGGEDAVDAAVGREWPLRLVPFTPPEVNVSGGPNQPVLFELLGQPDGAPWNVWAELNPETARAFGVANGAKVRITSASGSIDATAMLVERTPPDIVAVAFVPALRAGGRWARLMSADVRQLIGADHAAVRVRVMPGDGGRAQSGKAAAKET
jgi:anaerobic selenocysteine-containing dehydrogenase